MNEKILLDILNQVEGQMLWLLVKLMVVGVIILMLKSFMQRIVAYIGFRINKQLGKRSKVRIRGIEGEIEDFDTKWIYVKTNQGMELIPIENWKKEKWALI